ncbi:hypothetical protein D3C77_716080 [compost metagenome]
MHFAGVHRDDVPGAGLDLAAAAVRDLGALAHDADAELFVRVARERMPAVRGHGLHAGEGAALHDELA